MFVGGRAIRAGYGNVEQPQIYRKLSAMVNQVAQHEITKHFGAFSLKARAAFDFELPVLFERRVGEGFFVRLPGELIVRQPFQWFARGRRLAREFSFQRVCLFQGG